MRQPKENALATRFLLNIEKHEKTRKNAQANAKKLWHSDAMSIRLCLIILTLRCITQVNLDLHHIIKTPRASLPHAPYSAHGNAHIKTDRASVASLFPTLHENLVT